MNKTFIFFSLLCIGVTGCWFQAPRMPPSTGSLGKYKFSSRAELNAFNAEMIEWLSQRGYTPCTNETYDAVVGRDEWKMPGVLLSHRYDSTSQVWVFIPDCYQVDENIQIVGYHMALQGVLEEVNQHRKDFASIQLELQKRFPTTWEYTTGDAEQNGAAQGSPPIRSDGDSTSPAASSPR